MDWLEESDRPLDRERNGIEPDAHFFDSLAGEDQLHKARQRLRAHYDWVRVFRANNGHRHHWGPCVAGEFGESSSPESLDLVCLSVGFLEAGYAFGKDPEY